MKDSLAQAAQSYLEAGLSVLPASRTGKRPAVRTWAKYQKNLPTEAEVRAWFANTHDALCLIAGEVSGNLELLDFDRGGEMFGPWVEKVESALPGLMDRLVIEVSQSGGRHVVYRCESEIARNMKLAQRKGEDGEIVALIETRGEGGLFLCAPSEGYELKQGDLLNLPVLTEDERKTLLQIGWELNEYTPDRPPKTPEVGPCGPRFEGGNEDRPGDDFNARGDLRALLRKYGWQFCYVHSDGNEHWTRPGKPRGNTSATLKDGQFYVFSSNAAPFEQNKSYSAFAVYAMLEHGGNFEMAASALSLEGYGNVQPEATDVNISRIVAKAKLEPSQDVPDDPVMDPGPIPADLMQVPGYVGRVMDFCLHAAPYPSVPLAFCGAMSLQSYLCIRKVREEGGLRPNLYMLALAGSGSGKGYPRKVNAHILKKIGCGGALGNQISTGQGLEDAMLVHLKMLCQTDEVDNMLRSLTSSRENYQNSLLSMLLQFFTSADETHVMRLKANAKGSEPRGEIDQPGLVLFGTATPECFFEAMSPRLLTNGLFSRSTIVDAGPRGRRTRTYDVATMPRSLIETAAWWRDYNPEPVDPVTGKKPDLNELHPVPSVVPYTDEGRRILDALGTQADDEYDLAESRGDRVRAVLWTRVCENATRLALNYACSRDYREPCIDAEAAEWAVRFARHLADRMLYLAGAHVAENPFHADCLKVLDKLRSEPNRELTHSVLLKRMKIDAREFQGIIETLFQRGDIVSDTTSTRGRPSVVYRLRNPGE